MLIQSVRFTFDIADAVEAEAQFRELRDASRKEAGVVGFEVAKGVEQPNVFALWEVYRDQDALDAHQATDHFARLVLNGVRPLAQQRSADLVVPI